MLWENIVGQDETVGYLRKLIKDGVLSHAYLFNGPRGVGKYTTAKIFAAAMNCEGGSHLSAVSADRQARQARLPTPAAIANGGQARLPTPAAIANGGQACGECLSCRKTKGGIHPDVFLIEPEGNFITIGQIREVQHEVALKPLESQFRIVLIDEAEKLNEAAANALLKILEEPPAYLVFILVTDSVEEILPTIASRCQMIRFKQVPVDIIERLLVDSYGVSRGKAKLVAKLSEGTFGEALSFVQLGDKFNRRLKILSITDRIPYRNLSKLFDDVDNLISEVKKSLEKVKLEQKESFARLKEIATSNSHLARLKRRLEQKGKRELIKMERQGFSQILQTLAYWYRDLLVFSHTSDEELVVNIDQITKLKIASEVTDTFRVRQALNVVLETKNLLRANVNVRLALEVMLMKLQEVS